MNRAFLWMLTAIAFTSFHSAEAQQLRKLPRVGYLIASSPSAESARVDASRQGLRQLGYVEGENIVIEYRWAEGKSRSAA
jgi:putative ABC transport system substrate-binding protein